MYKKIDYNDLKTITNNFINKVKKKYPTIEEIELKFKLKDKVKELEKLSMKI
jgi:hypothetical protein